MTIPVGATNPGLFPGNQTKANPYKHTLAPTVMTDGEFFIRYALTFVTKSPKFMAQYNAVLDSFLPPPVLRQTLRAAAMCVLNNIALDP